VELNGFMAKTKRDINRKIRQVIREHDEYKRLKKTLQKGKRLRPTLTILSFYACGGNPENYAKALEVAVSTELCHTASLVHDDIIDRDRKRRGKPALYANEGIPNALLLGHRLITLGLTIAVKHGLPTLKTVIDAWDKALKGETLDVDLLKEKIEKLPTPARALYYDVIINKTSSLFAAATKVGAQEAEANDNLQQHMYKYGEQVGTAYQLADDYVDFKKHGKVETLPLIVLTQLEEGAKKTFYDLIEQAKFSAIEALSRVGFNAKTWIYNQLDTAVEQAENLATSNMIPESKYKSLLSEIPSYYVNLMLRAVGEEYLSLKG